MGENPIIAAYERGLCKAEKELESFCVASVHSNIKCLLNKRMEKRAKSKQTQHKSES